MSETAIMTEQTDAANEHFDSEAFESPEDALGVESGDELADEIEALLNESTPQPETSNASETAESTNPKAPNAAQGFETTDTAADSPSSIESTRQGEAGQESIQSTNTVNASATEAGFEASETWSAQSQHAATTNNETEPEPLARDSGSGKAEGQDVALEAKSAEGDPGLENADSSQADTRATDSTQAQTHADGITDQAAQAHQDQSTSSASASASATQGQTPATNPAPAPNQATALRKGPSKLVGAAERSSRQTLAALNAPLGHLSSDTRTLLGYVALATFLNAAALLAYALLV